MRALLLAAMVIGTPLAGVASYVGTGELFALAWDAWDAAMAGAGLAIPAGPGAVFSNPAALARERGFAVSSTLGDTFGGASASALAANFTWLGLGGVRLNAGEGGASLLHEGAALGLGVPVTGQFSLGGRLRVLHLVLPEEQLGWSVDLAGLYRGEVAAAVVVDALTARAPTPGEGWPATFSLGLAFPLGLGDHLSGWVALAATGIGEESLAARLGMELWVGGLGVRFGLSPEALAMGASAGWRDFRLNLVAKLSAGLSAAFAATLIFRWG